MVLHILPLAAANGLPLLPEEDRALRVKLDRQGDNSKRDGQNNQPQQCPQEINMSFQEPLYLLPSPARPSHIDPLSSPLRNASLHTRSHFVRIQYKD